MTKLKNSAAFITIIWIIFLSGCGISSDNSTITKTQEEKIRAEERIRADEQRTIQKEQNSKELHDWGNKVGINTTEFDAKAKSLGVDPDQALQQTKNAVEGRRP